MHARNLLYSVLATTAAIPSQAQWVKTSGPDSARSLASGSVVFGGDVVTEIVVAATRQGIFLSNNRGTTWGSPMSPTNVDVTSASVAFLRSFVGASNGGIYVSTNGGSLWQTRQLDSTNPTVRIFGASSTTLFAGTNGGVFRSANGGDTWLAVKSGLSNLSVRALAASDSVVYAGTDSGVFRSTNNGDAWAGVSAGLTSTVVRSLALSGTAVIAATDAGVFRRPGNGTGWTAANTGLTNITVRELTTYNGTIFAATDSGVFMSADYGVSWSAANTGFVNLRVRALASIYRNSLLAATDSGIWRRPLAEFLSAPSNLFYTPDSFWYTDGILPSWNPTVTGAVTQWSVYPPLPSGMTLNAGTGVITGVPTAQFNWTHFTITAANVSGSATAVIYIKNSGGLSVRPGAAPARLRIDPAGSISFSLLYPTRVRLTACNPAGKMVAVLIEEVFPAGTHTRHVETRAMPNGLYVYRLRVGDATESRTIAQTR